MLCCSAASGDVDVKKIPLLRLRSLWRLGNSARMLFDMLARSPCSEVLYSTFLFSTGGFEVLF